jgi:tetratricopeptide (TPR) repeat protein
MPLTVLGNALGLSYASTGFAESLSESICLHREAVQLVSPTHPQRGVTVSSLKQALMASFRHCHERSMLTEAIALLRESLSLVAEGSQNFERMNELAEALIASFNEQNDLDHLNEALHLHRKALKYRPPGHHRRMESLQSLGRLLCRVECRSWSEALALYSEALDTCPVGSPLRAEMLCNSSRCFLDPDSPFFDLSQGVAHLSEAYADNLPCQSALAVCDG